MKQHRPKRNCKDRVSLASPGRKASHLVSAQWELQSEVGEHCWAEVKGQKYKKAYSQVRAWLIHRTEHYMVVQVLEVFYLIF